MSDLWTWLDRGSILLSYVTLITLIFAAVQGVRLVRDYRRRQRELQKLAVGSSSRPVALAISFGGSIETAVKDFLAQRYPGATIPVREYQETGEVTTQNVFRHLNQLRLLKERLQSEGVSEVHLFYKGPLAVATGLGAIFDNWVTVKVYQNNRAGLYEDWLTLDTAKAQPVLTTITDAALAILERREKAE